jgi:hypothetical protein
MFIPDPDPTIFVIPDPGSYIKKWGKKFFLPDQMITVVNDHTKFNFSSFRYFFKGKNYKFYQFHYLNLILVMFRIRDPQHWLLDSTVRYRYRYIGKRKFLRTGTVLGGEKSHWERYLLYCTVRYRYRYIGTGKQKFLCIGWGKIGFGTLFVIIIRYSTVPVLVYRYRFYHIGTGSGILVPVSISSYSMY